MSKSTLALSIHDDFPDCGEGTLDFFEILKFKVKAMYYKTTPEDYLEKYFCFEKFSCFKPEDRHLDLKIKTK